MTDQEYADLMQLHAMALMNVAGLDFEEFRARNLEYHDHKDRCIELYGVEKTLHAEYYGVSESK